MNGVFVIHRQVMTHREELENHFICFIQIINVPIQTNGYDCGVFLCMVRLISYGMWATQYSTIRLQSVLHLKEDLHIPRFYTMIKILCTYKHN